MDHKETDREGMNGKVPGFAALNLDIQDIIFFLFDCKVEEKRREPIHNDRVIVFLFFSFPLLVSV